MKLLLEESDGGFCNVIKIGYLANGCGREHFEEWMIMAIIESVGIEDNRNTSETQLITTITQT